MNNLIRNKPFQLIIVLAVGVFLGWFFFKSDSGEHQLHDQEHSEESTTYTCSMHPQIRQEEPGQCPICGMDLIPAVQRSVGGESSPFIYTMSANAVALANVQTQKVRPVSAEHEIQLTGKVALNEQEIAVLTANYAGRIENLFVDFTGQSVNVGQKLATIYSPELVTAQRELIEASKFREVNPRLYEAAKEKLRLWKISDSQIDEIMESEDLITEFEVFADRSGVVIERNVSRGDYVNRGNVLFEIADLSKVWIFFDAYESDLPFLKTGQQLSFSTPSLPGREFKSVVSFIDPMINPQSRTVAVRAEVRNPGFLLKPEMFVDGKITAGSSVGDKGLAVPNTSILWTGKRSVVYVKVPDAEFPTFEMREITLGASLGTSHLVESGLSEGEEIVVNGVFAVDAAAQLSGNYSMMTKAPDHSLPAPERFRNQLTGLVNQYFELSNSLVQSDLELSTNNIQKMKAALKKIEAELLDSEAEKAWLKYSTELNRQIELLEDAADLEEIRAHFSDLSNQLLETIEAFKIAVEAVYLAYCPMALDNEGAYWLSTVEEIYNPYFGDRMLRCGEIKRTVSGSGNKSTKTQQENAHRH